MKRPGLNEACDLISKLVDPVIYDIGAYEGKIAKKFLDANLGGKVYAVEACPKNCEYLEDAFRLDPRITVVHAAICDRNGEIDFYVTDRPHCIGTSQSNTLYKKLLKVKKKEGKIKDFESVKVPSYTIHTFMSIFKTPDVIKLNCEGAEYDILEDDELLNTVKVIFVSFHCQKYFDANQRNNIYGNMAKHGFECVSKKQKEEHSWELWAKLTELK